MGTYTDVQSLCIFDIYFFLFYNCFVHISKPWHSFGPEYFCVLENREIKDIYNYLKWRRTYESWPGNLRSFHFYNSKHQQIKILTTISRHWWNISNSYGESIRLTWLKKTSNLPETKHFHNENILKKHLMDTTSPNTKPGRTKSSNIKALCDYTTFTLALTVH